MKRAHVAGFGNKNGRFMSRFGKDCSLRFESLESRAMMTVVFTLSPDADLSNGTVLTISGSGTTTSDTHFLNQNLGIKDIGDAFDSSHNDPFWTLSPPLEFIGAQLTRIRTDSDPGGGDDFALITSENTPINTSYNLSGITSVESLPFSSLNVGSYTSSTPGQNDATLALGGFQLNVSSVPVSIPPDVTQIEIDIKPGSGTNPINLKSNGRIAVAILSTSIANGDTHDFDASTVEVNSIKIGGSNVSGRASLINWTFEDVDNDGDTDLVVHFSMRDIKQQGAISADSVDLILEAETIDGVNLSGTDSLRIVGGNGP